jgi:hypothetical protein
VASATTSFRLNLAHMAGSKGVVDEKSVVKKDGSDGTGTSSTGAIGNTEPVRFRGANTAEETDKGTETSASRSQDLARNVGSTRGMSDLARRNEERSSGNQNGKAAEEAPGAGKTRGMPGLKERSALKKLQSNTDAEANANSGKTRGMEGLKERSVAQKLQALGELEARRVEGRAGTPGKLRNMPMASRKDNVENGNVENGKEKESEKGIEGNELTTGNAGGFDANSNSGIVGAPLPGDFL